MVVPFMDSTNNGVENVVHTEFFEGTRPRPGRKDLGRSDRRGNGENGGMDLWALSFRNPSLVHWPDNNIHVGERKRPLIRTIKDGGFAA